MSAVGLLRTVSIICQDGGLEQALQYAAIASKAGLPVLVNFPSIEGYPIAANVSELINPRTGAVILIISKDVLTKQRSGRRIEIDREVFQELQSLTMRGASSRLFLIVADEESELLIEKNTWMSRLQWLRDDVINREKVLTSLRQRSEQDQTEAEITSFANAASVIADSEQSSITERIANEQLGTDGISYEIFKCSHRIRRDDITYYLHLHRGITIRNTANHIRINYPEIFNARNKMIVLNIEPGHVAVDRRISSVKAAFRSESVEYLETIMSRLLSATADVSQMSGAQMTARRFVEPQIRRGVGQDIPPSEYSRIKGWLSSPRAGILVLIGQGGIGKTWAMLNLRQMIWARKVEFTKPIDRNIIFLTSTDIARGFARSPSQTSDLTLYDLYDAARASLVDGEVTHRLNRETFYNALELGSLIVFVDGLDEVIARHRARFNVVSFFDDIAKRLNGDSDGKVIISCRNIFFDFDECRIERPFVETFELLAFDRARRDRFFAETLRDMPRRQQKAISLSESLAGIASRDERRYIPFVLDLIKDVMIEQAEDAPDDAIDLFQSSVLNPQDLNDRVVGQFCNREIVKIQDPIRDVTVDEQVAIFSGIARAGRVDRAGLEIIIARCLGKKDIARHADHFVTHPFISQEELSRKGTIEFRFDFMPEYFLMLDMLKRIIENTEVTEDDIRIFIKYCSLNSHFSRGIAERVQVTSEDFHLKLMDLNEKGAEVIQEKLPPDDDDLFQPDSAAAQFSFALVALLTAYETRNGAALGSGFTDGLKEIFGHGNTLRRVALLDGFVRGDERLRVDFRGLRVEECLFRSFDIWNCQYDANSSFSKCRFMNCGGTFRKASGMQRDMFQSDCQIDEEFERILRAGDAKIKSTEAQNIEAIRSFVSDFYRQGAFRRISVENVKRYYGTSHSIVPFSKIERAMRKHGITEEIDRGDFVEMRIARSATADCERLITQGVISGKLKNVALDLR